MDAPEGLEIVLDGDLLQMILEDDARLEPNRKSYDFIELGLADVAEMVELATLTKPGPFDTRTREMGRIWGYARTESLSLWLASG